MMSCRSTAHAVPCVYMAGKLLQHGAQAGLPAL